ncbi:MAG: hypothetical protein IJM62_02305 [Lachnospiraceae bacterium]|nr:hypothetical protein [Lachnospiraceae bacterium]
MKKLLSVLLAALMILSLAACGKSGGGADKDPVIGTWKAVSAEYGGTTMDVPEITNEVKEDGTFIYSAQGTTYEGTWKNDNGTYTFEVGGDPVNGSISGSQLTMYEGELTIVFEKK